jgi:molybdopterin converting factor small subunit
MLEALDHIQQELKEAAATEAEKKSNELTNMATAQALTSQMLEHYEEWAKNAEQAQAIMSALQQFLAEAKLPANLSSNLLGLTSNTAQLDPATLEQLAKMISKEMLDNLSQLQQSQDLKLIDSSQCRSGNCQGNSCTNYMCATENLAQLLQDSGNASAMSLAAMCGLPGVGGISEGGGPSPMTWGEASSYDGVKFTDERLASANLPDFEKAELTGLSASVPEVPAEAAAAGRGALATGQNATGSASQAIILPHHRQTVSRYFE